MINQIKELRVKCDGYAQLTKELKPIGDSYSMGMTEKEKKKFYKYENSKEIEKAVDSLYLAKGWLGKLLGELGTANPYGSGYKTKEDIVPTQDVSKVQIKFPLVELPPIFEEASGNLIPQSPREMNHVEKTDWLRTEIEGLVKEVKDISTRPDNGQQIQILSREFSIARTNCYNHLCEAKMWLGFEFEKIKNEA